MKHFMIKVSKEFFQNLQMLSSVCKLVLLLPLLEVSDVKAVCHLCFKPVRSLRAAIHQPFAQDDLHSAAKVILNGNPGCP